MAKNHFHVSRCESGWVLKEENKLFPLTRTRTQAAAIYLGRMRARRIGGVLKIHDVSGLFRDIWSYKNSSLTSFLNS